MQKSYEFHGLLIEPQDIKAMFFNNISRRLWILILACAIPALSVYVSVQQTNTPQDSLPYALSAFLALVLLVLFVVMFAYHTAQKKFGLHPLHNVRFAIKSLEDGFTLCNPERGNWNYFWRDFSCYHETDCVFILRLKYNQNWLIPKRHLTAEDITTFRAALNAGIPSKKSLKNSALKD